MIFFLALLATSILGCAKICSELPEALKKSPLEWAFADSTFQFCSRLRIEGFYGKNVQFLNNENGGLDQTIIPARHTIDLNGLYRYGEEKYGYPLVTIKCTVRNKGVWGDPESIASTDLSTVKVADAVTGEHFHALNRHYLWIRELWVESVINDMFGLNFANNHTLTAGFFSFELGRGISLGDAYTVDPDFLGFYSPNAVDQYAPGFKLAGMLDDAEHVHYDLYAAILANRSGSFFNVNKKIMGQEYGRFCTPARGFGKINWLAAARLQWTAYQEGSCNLMIEPYVLFVDQREQRVEFLGDAESKLGTVGFAVEATLGILEWGFEFAQNLGRQRVRGWDRNIISMVSRTGSVVEVNTEVTALNTVAPDEAGKNALFTSANQKIVDSAIQSQAQNGQQIGMSNLKNSDIRFRNPYTNTFDGRMAVWDMSVCCSPAIRCAVTAGLATGDLNPNRDLDEIGDSQIDGNYGGFISVQEQYAGKRVKSAFLMSGAGKIPRILSVPAENVGDPFPDKTSQFTNLIFAGLGMNARVGSWNINPNVINYWQQNATRVFDRTTEKPLERYASTWLGLEFNLFVDVCLDNSMKLFAVTSVFLPGSHYSDIQGIPLNKAQQKFLNSVNTTGAPAVEQVPVLGTNPAFTLNAGVEYRF